MAQDRDQNNLDLFSQLEEALYQYNENHGIEYLDYKKRQAYDYESERMAWDKEFLYFPFEEINAIKKIQIFHTFYETAVWGILGPVKLGDEKLLISMKEIERNVAIDKPQYIFLKLKLKYSSIAEDIPQALIGYKEELKLKDDHPEEPVLINLLNLYNRILSNTDSQLSIFEYIFLNKNISDLYTELLKDLIENRLKLLRPRIRQYKKQLERKVEINETEIQEEIPLIKLNFNPEQQKQIIRCLYENLNHDFIDTSYHQFERHFVAKRSKIRKFVWKGKEPEIAHLFRSMKIKNIIISENQNKLIELHFFNRKGQTFNYRQLSVSLSKTQIENYPKILYIVHELEKLVLTFN